jgi:hypothetical protein
MKAIFRIIVTLSIFFLANQSYSQAIAERWHACLGGTDWDEGSGIIEAGGSYWVVSNVESGDGDISNNHGRYDIWLANIDSLGNLIFETTFGGSMGDGGNTDILKISDSTFYIVATTLSTDGDISPYTPSKALDNYLILKVNTRGEILWDKVLGGNRIDRIQNGLVTSDGGIIAFGYTNSEDGDITQYFDDYDLWMVKLSGEGEIQWDFTLGSFSGEGGGAIKQTSDGGYIVIGHTSGGEGGNFDTTCNYHGPGGYGYLDVWVVKLDSLRNIEWQQCYGGQYHELGANILELEDGYLCLGMASSDDGDVSGYHGYPGYPEFGGDIWVFKIDFGGNLLWQKCLGGTFMDYANNIFTTSDGGFMIVGQTSSDDGDVEGYHGFDRMCDDIWLAKITADGELTWQYCYGGAGKEYIYKGVWQKGDYNYVLAIGTDTDEWQCRGPMYPDVRVFELGDTTTDVIPEYTTTLRVYPNPAQDWVTFEIGGNEPTTLIIYNHTGQLVEKLELTGSRTSWNVGSLPRGLYFYRAEQDGKTVVGKLVLSGE